LTRRLKPILPNLIERLGINVIIGRITTTGNNKNTSKNKVSPLSSPSPRKLRLKSDQACGGILVFGALI
jgi:hypothetical protein